MRTSWSLNYSLHGHKGITVISQVGLHSPGRKNGHYYKQGLRYLVLHIHYSHYCQLAFVTKNGIPFQPKVNFIFCVSELFPIFLFSYSKHHNLGVTVCLLLLLNDFLWRKALVLIGVLFRNCSVFIPHVRAGERQGLSLGVLPFTVPRGHELRISTEVKRSMFLI